jgi:hypothetical protein
MSLNQLKGKSIIDLLWEDLDDTVDILMDECENCQQLAGAHPYANGRFYCNAPVTNLVLEYDVREYRGRAQGVAYAIALMSNPYLSDVAAVRKLAKERYQQRAAGQEVTPLRTKPTVAAVGED